MHLYSKVLGKGSPFIILHGFLGMSDNWRTLGKKFSEKQFEVHLVDQRNHGRSFHDDTFNYEVLVEDLKTYIDDHQLQDVILLGHSMGGKVAMLFATQYPKLVSKLIVADISPRFYPVHHDQILNGMKALDFDEIHSRSLADKILENYVSSKGIRQFLLKNLYWKDKGVLALRINLNVLAEHVSEVGEALPLQAKFDGGTLFLRGDKSEYISFQDEDVIKSHFPKANIVTIANAGHWLHAENPQDFFIQVMQFVN